MLYKICLQLQNDEETLIRFSYHLKPTTQQSNWPVALPLAASRCTARVVVLWTQQNHIHQLFWGPQPGDAHLSWINAAYRVLEVNNNPMPHFGNWQFIIVFWPLKSKTEDPAVEDTAVMIALVHTGRTSAAQTLCRGAAHLTHTSYLRRAFAHLRCVWQAISHDWMAVARWRRALPARWPSGWGRPSVAVMEHGCVWMCSWCWVILAVWQLAAGVQWASHCSSSKPLNV